MLRRILVFVWLLVLGVAVAPGSDARPPKRHKVLYLGIDGCRPDALRNANTPNLDAVINSGAYSFRAQTNDITVSGPSWSSALTGVWRDKHGVHNNDFDGSQFERYPHFFVRLKEQRPNLVTASIVHWAPIHSKIVAGADFSLAVGSDAAVAKEAAHLLRTGDPDVLFLHFDDVDHAGHGQGYGPRLPHYLEAIAVMDRHIGTVLAALRSRADYGRESWLVLATTDHGGTGTGHGENIPAHRTIFAIVGGPAARPGEIHDPPGIVDLPVTALAHLGVTIDPAWGLDGRAVGLK